MVTVYGNCPKCSIVKSKLKAKNIEYIEENDIDVIMEMGKLHKISSMPIVDWDNEILDFSKTVEKINKLQGNGA